MDATFRVRYQARQADGRSNALFVEDGDGALYLFSGGKLQLRFDPMNGWHRLRTYFAHAQYSWRAVEGDDRHPLEALRTLDTGPRQPSRSGDGA